ncbi:type VI secretion system baseplate subunit TssE [Siccirubricoccus deserti]
MFDLDPAAADSADARLLKDADLRLSVARHLGHLLDCRSPAREAGQDLTVLDWGVPDMGALPPRDRRAQATWLAEVRRSLACFEPRLRNPELQLQTGTEAGRSTLCIRGSIGTADAAAPVLFELALEAAASGS